MFQHTVVRNLDLVISVVNKVVCVYLHRPSFVGCILHVMPAMLRMPTYGM